MKIEIKQTGDGSMTLYRPDLNETYHSIHGAVQESRHVFIKNGIQYFIEKQGVKSLKIFELGFGTGLNALLSMELSKCQSKNIKYYASEKYVLKSEVLDKINYSAYTEFDLSQQFALMHAVDHNCWNKIEEQFELFIDTNDIINSSIQSNHFDIIFFDAFAPNKQPELWTPAVFQKMYDLLKTEGILVTYCAKGQVKRDLHSVGFDVASVPGPPGKREMIRAVKP